MNLPRFKTPPVGAQILFAIGVNLAQTAVCIWTGGAENIAWGFMLVTCGLYIVLINAVNRGQVPEAVRIAYVSSMAVQILHRPDTDRSDIRNSKLFPLSKKKDPKTAGREALPFRVCIVEVEW